MNHSFQKMETARYSCEMDLYIYSLLKGSMYIFEELPLIDTSINTLH